MMNFADQIFQALMQQQMQPQQVEVDEMAQGQQAVADQMAEIQAEGQTPVFQQGMDSMREALAQRNVKNKEKRAGGGYYGSRTGAV